MQQILSLILLVNRSYGEDHSSAIPEFEPGLVKDIAEHAQMKAIRASEQLMKTGQYFRSTMLVLQGLVKVYREDEKGMTILFITCSLVRHMRSPMICAIRQQASQLMGKVVTDTTILAIPLEYMDSWITKYKSWYYYVLGSYVSPLSYSVFTASAASFLLAGLPAYKWSLDNVFS